MYFYHFVGLNNSSLSQKMEDSDDIKNFEHIRDQPTPDDIHSMYSVGKLLGNETQSQVRLKSIGMFSILSTLVFLVIRSAAPWLAKKYNFPSGVLSETLLYACLIVTALSGSFLIKTIYSK